MTPQSLQCAETEAAVESTWAVRGASEPCGDIPAVRYEACGAPNGPVIVVLGGISASRHVTRNEVDGSPGWWEDTVGPGRTIDTDENCVVGIDYLVHLEGAGGDPDFGRPVTTVDQARALEAALDALGVGRVRAIVGASYGGMIALAAAARAPERIERIVVISAAHRSEPMATAMRAIQRRIVGLAERAGASRDGVALARALAMTTYGTRNEFNGRFDNAPNREGYDITFPAEEYAVAGGEGYANRTTSADFCALTLSLDLHSIAPESITVPTTLIGIVEDQLIPIERIRELQRELAGPSSLKELSSVFGHDAFLRDADRMRPLIIDGLRDASACRPAAFTTRAVRAGIATDLEHGAVVPPIHLSSTFAFESFAKPRTYDYTRSGNPTRAHLATILAELEGGAGAVVTSSGMSAVAVVLQALVKPGDHVVAAHDCYGGTHRILRSLAARGQFSVDFVDLSLPTYRRSLARSPRLVWVETPSNPLLRITDIRGVCDAAHQAGSLVVVDNTFLSPALQRPIEFGADIVVHSTTKYLNGHSDVVGGAVIARDVELATEIGWWANCIGVTGAPFDSYLTLRGVRTLSARMRVHEDNGGAVAHFLAAHPAVARVYYPGLSAHPGHALARRQQLGFGAMISFEVYGGQRAVEHVTRSLRYFSLAESLGGVESLIAHPATMTHSAMGPEARATAGISDSLLRLSVGIENADDLCDDLRAALDGIALHERLTIHS